MFAISTLLCYKFCIVYTKVRILLTTIYLQVLGASEVNPAPALVWPPQAHKSDQVRSSKVITNHLRCESCVYRQQGSIINSNQNQHLHLLRRSIWFAFVLYFDMVVTSADSCKWLMSVGDQDPLRRHPKEQPSVCRISVQDT